MDKLYELKDSIIEELEHQADKGLTRDSLDTIDKLAHAGKNVAKLIKCCEEEQGGSSYAMPDGSYDGSMAGYRRSYNGPWSGGANGREGMGMSGARGRMRAARDSMGRYSRMSNASGYSGHDTSEFAEELRKMGMNLPENFRGEIMRMADKMEHIES